MIHSDLIHTINQKLTEEFEVNIDQIESDAPLMETLGLDSLDLIDVVVLVEQNFGLTLKPENFLSIKTFQDFYDLIGAHLNEAKE